VNTGLDCETYYISLLHPSYNVRLNARFHSTLPWTQDQLNAHLKTMKLLALKSSSKSTLTLSKSIPGKSIAIDIVIPKKKWGISIFSQQKSSS